MPLPSSTPPAEPGDAPSARELSIAERLKRLGYGHRPSGRMVDRDVGRREVYDLTTGEIAGRFTAARAIEFLNEREG